jgi:hypothetical protein
MDRKTPVHECRIADEDEGSDSKSSLIGFAAPADDDAPYEMRKRRNGRSGVPNAKFVHAMKIEFIKQIRGNKVMAEQKRWQNVKCMAIIKPKRWPFRKSKARCANTRVGRTARDMKESLELIATKIGRISFMVRLTNDSWHDISGYAKLCRPAG